MILPPLTDEQLKEVVDALEAHGGNRAEAARSIGLKRTTFIARLKRAARRGIIDRIPPSPNGFEARSYSEQFDKDGNLKGRSVKYGHEVGDTFELPANREIGKVTVQVGAGGEIEREWIRHDNDIHPDRIAKIIMDAFEGFTPTAPAIVRHKNHDEKRLTLYPLSDWHVGMFSWGKETDGPDWDLGIAKKTLIETFAELVDQTPMSKHAIVLGLGDLLHADSPKNQTPQSGNIMDVDTRYAKCLPVVCDIVAECCELVRQKHNLVEVAIKQGNHDIASSVGIRQALRMFYRNDGKVSVNESPSPYYWKRFGVNLISATHGDGIKAKDLPLFMANVKSEEWSETKSKHAHTGHLHSEMTFEHGGVKVHQHRAPIPADAWHHAQGYRSGRSMRAFHYHFDKGARGVSEVEIL